jgi:hypothetical protein
VRVRRFNLDIGADDEGLVLPDKNGSLGHVSLLELF